MSREQGAGWPKLCKRVVLVDPRAFGLGGRETAVRNLADALRRIGVVVEIVSVFPGEDGGDYPSRIVFSNEQLYRRPVARQSGRRVTGTITRLPRVVAKRVRIRSERRRFRRWIERLHDDTVVIFTDPLGRQVLRESGYRRPAMHSPIFIGQHHMAFDSLASLPGDAAGIVAREFSDADGYVALSKEDAASFTTLLGIACICIPNSYGESITVPGRIESLERRAVALVRYSAEKRIDMMIRAFSSATAGGQHSNWRLDLYGEGEQRETLEVLIETLGVGERVTLNGRTADVGKVLGGADLLLLTSRTEGFPLSVIEAAQYGVPSLVTDSGHGVRALIKQLDGYLVSMSGGEVEYARALADVMADPEGLKERARAASLRVEAYAPEVVLGMWADFVGSIYARRATR